MVGHDRTWTCTVRDGTRTRNVQIRGLMHYPLCNALLYHWATWPVEFCGRKKWLALQSCNSCWNLSYQQHGLQWTQTGDKVGTDNLRADSCNSCWNLSYQQPGLQWTLTGDKDNFRDFGRGVLTGLKLFAQCFYLADTITWALQVYLLSFNGSVNSSLLWEWELKSTENFVLFCFGIPLLATKTSQVPQLTWM